MDFVKEASEGSSPTSSSIQNRAHEGLNNRDADTVASTSNTAVETVDTESSTGNNSITSGGKERDICRFYRQGKCTRGDTCVFSHNIPPDEVDKPRNGKICFFFFIILNQLSPMVCNSIPCKQIKWELIIRVLIHLLPS